MEVVSLAPNALKPIREPLQVLPSTDSAGGLVAVVQDLPLPMEFVQRCVQNHRRTCAHKQRGPRVPIPEESPRTDGSHRNDSRQSSAQEQVELPTGSSDFRPSLKDTVAERGTPWRLDLCGSLCAASTLGATARASARASGLTRTAARSAARDGSARTVQQSAGSKTGAAGTSNVPAQPLASQGLKRVATTAEREPQRPSWTHAARTARAPPRARALEPCMLRTLFANDDNRSCVTCSETLKK